MIDVFQAAINATPTAGIKYSVYKGMRPGSDTIVYIGTTIQKPEDRFRWHKANGKPLVFVVLHQFDNEDEMLDKEFELILDVTLLQLRSENV